MNIRSTRLDFYSQFRRVFLWVLAAHLIIALISFFGLPDFNIKRRPDITIELSVLAPSSGATVDSIAQPSALPRKSDENPLPKDKDGVLNKSAKEIIENANSINSMAGPANAQTVDPDYKASYLRNPKPPYPPLAVKMRLEGKVLVLVEVLPNGRAGKVAIESSSGHGLLDQSALQTIKEWQFTPARKDGVIIAQVVRIPINFNLKSR
jgi:periplasmic protein TonB